MSRIFDALRRSGGEPANRTSSRGVGEEVSWRGLMESLEAETGKFEHGGRVQCRLEPESHIVAHHDEQHLGAQRFRLLSHRLQQLRQRRPLGRLLVTSAARKDGKTVVAVNLAATLARTSGRVALIDGDMRQSGINRVLGLHLTVGLADYLEGRVELAAAFRIADPLGVYYLPSGLAPSNSVELLQSSRMDELMMQVAAAFDWVVFDSPPLNPFAEAQHLASVTDGVLLVVRSEATRKEALKQSLTFVDAARVVGVVLNACRDNGHE